MRPLRSIRWRLQLWYGLLIGVLLAAFGVTAYEFERSRRLEAIDSELERLAVEFNVGNRNPGPPRPEGAPPKAGGPRPITELYTAEHAARGIYYALWSRNRSVRAVAANAPSELSRPAGRGLRWNGTRREAFLEGNPGDVTLAGREVAGDLAALHRLGWRIAGGCVAAWGATLLIGSWLVGRALRPIRDIGEAATKIATGNLAQRINTRDADSELGELAAVLNATFARLEAAFAQQGRFTADAAHELRTPLTVIFTHVQNALGAGELAEEQREALEACQRAAQRMRQLIDSLLQLARLDAGEDAMASGPLDLAEVARECVDFVRPLAAERAITIQAELGAAPAAGDRSQLGQVLTNLLTNAVHHNREAGQIAVWTGTEAGRAVVRVADRGPGIPAEHVPHIFQRFYRVDQARTGSRGRTGLGLAIAKAIVDAHGGELSVRSGAEGGTVFTVQLPGASR